MPVPHLRRSGQPRQLRRVSVRPRRRRLRKHGSPLARPGAARLPPDPGHASVRDAFDRRGDRAAGRTEHRLPRRHRVADGQVPLPG